MMQTYALDMLDDAQATLMDWALDTGDEDQLHAVSDMLSDVLKEVHRRRHCGAAVEIDELYA